jgi:hypothetical protein
MSLVKKVRNAINAHPRVTATAVVFGIGLAITFVGALDHSHLANAISQMNNNQQS